MKGKSFGGTEVWGNTTPRNLKVRASSLTYVMTYVVTYMMTYLMI